MSKDNDSNQNNVPMLGSENSKQTKIKFFVQKAEDNFFTGIYFAELMKIIFNIKNRIKKSLLFL